MMIPYKIEDHMVCLDIETLPGSDRPDPVSDEEFEEYVISKVPKSLKKVESVNVWMEDHREELRDLVVEEKEQIWRKESLKWKLGRVYCVGYAFGERDPGVLCEDTEEKTLVVLQSLLLERENAGKLRLFAYGHNYAGFDGPYLWKRAMKHGLHDLARITRPGKWGKNCGDTMTTFCEDEH